MWKIAHRGYCKSFKGNTLKSIEEAINNDFHIIEIDIQLDKNNNIILFHDTYINNKLVKDMTIDEIQQQYPDVILLKTMMKALFLHCKNKNIKLYFDLKGCDNLAHELHDFFIKKNLNLADFFIGSFNIHHLEILSKKNKNYNLGLITDNNFTIDIIYYIISKYNLTFVCFHWLILNKNIIQFLKSKQLYTFCYTLSDENKDFIFKYELDGIVSDILFE